MNALLPTSYFGNIKYYQTIYEKASIYIEAFEHIDKQTFRNRCEILTPNGVQSLSIPVNRINGSKTPVHLVELSAVNDWKKDHWKAIESAYSASPYFEHYGNEVKELIYSDEKNLLKFNQNIFDRIVSWLDLKIDYKFTSEFIDVKNNIEFEDFRNQLSQKKQELNEHTKYIQVFSKNENFHYNLSILDAIFCIGPMTRKIIDKNCF